VVGSQCGSHPTPHYWSKKSGCLLRRSIFFIYSTTLTHTYYFNIWFQAVKGDNPELVSKDDPMQDKRVKKEGDEGAVRV
jgi:hypothetical protein